MKAGHLIPLLDPLLHALSGVVYRLGNRHAMRHIRLLCSWSLKFEKGAKRWPVNDIEWLKTSKLTWLSLGQGWCHPPRHT
jgi:hypothetical protein